MINMKPEKIKQLLNNGRYSMMLGMQCERKDEELLKEKQEYQQLRKTLDADYSNSRLQLEYVNSQIESIQYALNEHERIELSKITPTDDHKKLLKQLDFKTYKDGGDYVFIGVDGKRPFGNSDVFGDVARILKWKLPNDDLSNEQYEKAEQLLKELPFALNNILKGI